MGPLPPSCQTWSRHISVLKRHTATTRPSTFAGIRDELLDRPPIIHSDNLASLATKTTILYSSLPGLVRKIPSHVRLRGPQNSTLVPQGHHLLGFAAVHPDDTLLPDGTDPDHSPGPPLTRRLWAGGSVTFSDDWKGHLNLSLTHHKSGKLECRESVLDARLAGAAPDTLGPGDKVFVDIERRYYRASKTADRQASPIVERRTLCFMAPKTVQDIEEDLAQPARKIIKHPSLVSQHSQSFRLTRTALFRFSALTFNAHRIHLERQYCREVEGYRDLLVHGPLLLVMMFSVLTNHGLSVRNLTYRNLAPVFVDEEIKVCLQETKEGKWTVWIVGPDEDLRVKGSAIIEDSAEDLMPKAIASQPTPVTKINLTHRGKSKLRYSKKLLANPLIQGA